MKRSKYIIFSMLVISLTLGGVVWAAESKEEKNLQKEVTAINTTAGTRQGEKVLVQKLEKEFTVTDTQIVSLRGQKLGYGEIAIVLSLAQKMPGGATDANIQQIMSTRQGPPTMGWGEVAKKLGTKLGPAVSQVKKVNRETNREMKREARGDKEQMEKHQERHEEQHKESMGHESMGGGQGMSHGKNK